MQEMCKTKRHHWHLAWPWLHTPSAGPPVQPQFSRPFCSNNSFTNWPLPNKQAKPKGVVLHSALKIIKFDRGFASLRGSWNFWVDFLGNDMEKRWREYLGVPPKQTKQTFHVYVTVLLFLLAFFGGQVLNTSELQNEDMCDSGSPNHKTHHWPQWFQGNSWHLFYLERNYDKQRQASPSMATKLRMTKHDSYATMPYLQMCLFTYWLHHISPV